MVSMIAPMVMQAEPRIPRAVKEHVESELYQYPTTLQRIAERRLDLILGDDAQMQETVPGRRSYISDPTGTTGTRVADDARMREMLRITRAIEAVRDDPSLGRAREVLDRQYWKLERSQDIADALGVSVQTVSRLRLLVVARVAAELGWWV